MARTQATGQQVADGSIQRVDIDTTTAGNALIRKAIAGITMLFTSTGVDAGTGDVTVNLRSTEKCGSATLTNNAVATVETIVASWAIVANILAAGHNLDIKKNAQVSGTATLTYRIRFGTTGTISDALVCTFTTTSGGAANAYVYLEGLISVLTSTTMTATGIVYLLSGFTSTPVTAAFAAATVNLAVANFLTISVVQSAVQTYTSRSAKLSA